MISVESDASSAPSSSSLRPNDRDHASVAASSAKSASRHASSSSLAKLTYAFPARPAGSFNASATASVTGVTGSTSATTISSAASSGRAGDNDDAGSIRSALSETSDPFKYDAVYTSSTRGLSHLAAPSVSSLHDTDQRGQQGQIRQRTMETAARNKELPPAPISPLSASSAEQYLVAKHDYTGTPGVCLSFSAGQVIKLVSKHESGWWDGELDGQRGWFPSNFVDDSLEAEGDIDSRSASPGPSQPPVRLHAQPMKRGASAPSPSLGGHSLDSSDRSNEGTESSRPPSPAFDASRRMSESDDLLASITHAVDVMRKAVAANRISHYRPATTCLISAVRSVLHAAGCLARESVILRTHVILSRERKQILSILAHLVTQSKNAAVPTLSPASRAIEVDAMVQLTDSVLNNVEHFLATAARCGINLPSNINDTAFESTSSASSFSTANLSSDSASFSGLRLDPHVERVFGLQEISTPNLDACLQFSQYEGVIRHSSTSSHHAADSGPAASASWTSSKAAHKARSFSEAKATIAAQQRRKGSEASATSSSGSAGSPLSAIPPLSAITGGSAFKNFDFLARPPASSQTGAASATPPVHPGMLRRPSIPAAYATGSIPSPAWPVSANDSISSASSLSSSAGPLTPANGQDIARGPVEVYRALSLIHNQLLSHIAAFVGQVHAHSRTSHSSSHAQLIEMARGATDMVHETLCILDAVVAQPSLAQYAKDIKYLRRHRETLYSVASTLVAATKRATTVSPIFDLADEARMQDQEEEEHAELLQAATGILRASADCIKASKPLLLKRGLEGVSFSVDDMLQTGPASRRESMSTEEAPSDEDVTLQHAIDSGVGSMDSTMVSPYTKRDSLHELRLGSHNPSGDANDNIARHLLGDWQLSQKTAPVQPPSRRSSRPILEDGLPHLPERSGSSLSTRRGVPVPSTLNIQGRPTPGGTRPPSFSGQSATSTITPMSHDKPGPLPVLRPLNTSQGASSTASLSSAGSSPYHKAGGEAMSRDESSRGSATSTATSSYRSAFSSDVNTADTSPRSSVAFPSPADEKADWGLLEQLSSGQQQATTGSRKTSRTDYFRARSGSTPDRLMALRLSEGAGQAAVPSPLSPRPPMTPSVVEQPQQTSGGNRGWLLERDYHAKECAFNANGSVTGGTLKCLVERMTLHDQTIDASFSNTFFLTFRMFTTPLELTEALFVRFKIPAPSGPAMTETDLKVWQAQKLIPVRLRIYNFFKTWLESHWKPDMDSIILDPLTSFTREHMMPTMSAAAQRLIDLIQKRNILRTSHTAGRARGLTRMASAEKLKAGKPVLDGQSLNSATFPGTQSALPPAPIVSKSLYSALRTAPFAPNTVLDFDPLELARQLTIMESKLFCAIQSEELIGQDFGKKSNSRMSNVRQMSTLSTRITGWIAEIILSEQDAKKRTALVKYFIKLGDRCLALQNFHTLMAILAALNSSTIARLKKTWEGLSNKYKAILEVLRKATECSRNYAEYRSHIRTAVAPCLPFLGIYLTDITFCFDGNPSHRASPLEADLRLINFDRYQRIARIVSDLQRFQQPFNLIEVPEIQTFLHGALANIENGGDPQALYRRSLQVEPRENQQEPVAAAPIKDIFGWRI